MDKNSELEKIKTILASLLPRGEEESEPAAGCSTEELQALRQKYQDYSPVKIMAFVLVPLAFLGSLLLNLWQWQRAKEKER